MQRRDTLILLVLATLLLLSCGTSKLHTKQEQKTSTAKYQRQSPQFNADSAYQFIEKQVAFGPRIPGTDAHKECANYLHNQLRKYGANVILQEADVIHYTGEKLKIKNIIARYNLDADRRLLLFAHYDTRPFADMNEEIALRTTPIDGADDGASGVAVLLEIARQIDLNPMKKGIDIILFDMEDWGQPHYEEYIPGEWWCVGSRYWSENPHIENYKAELGILLDMVGGENATFLYEGYSLQSAPEQLKRLWKLGQQLGYGEQFVSRQGYYITDDHLPVIQNLNIPCIDIIHQSNSDSGFAPYWHTVNDNISIIDRATLKAAGQTVMEFIYLEDKSNKAIKNDDY